MKNWKNIITPSTKATAIGICLFSNCIRRHLSESLEAKLEEFESEKYEDCSDKSPDHENELAKILALERSEQHGLAA